MTQRKNFLNQETSEDASYVIHMLAASNDPDERQRLAERLLRDLPIDQAARELGSEICTHILAQRAKKSTRRRTMYAVEDILTTGDDGRLRVDHERLAVAHSDTVSAVLATLRSHVATLMTEKAVQL